MLKQLVLAGFLALNSYQAAAQYNSKPEPMAQTMKKKFFSKSEPATITIKDLNKDGVFEIFYLTNGKEAIANVDSIDATHKEYLTDLIIEGRLKRNGNYKFTVEKFNYKNMKMDYFTLRGEQKELLNKFVKELTTEVNKTNPKTNFQQYMSFLFYEKTAKGTINYEYERSMVLLPYNQDVFVMKK